MEDGTNEEAASVAMLTQHQPDTPVSTDADFQSHGVCGVIEEGGSRDDAQDRLVNGSGRSEMTPQDDSIFSDPDEEDIWFEASEQLTTENSPQPSSPLTSYELPPEEKVATLADVVEGTDAEIEPMGTTVNYLSVEDQDSNAPMVTQDSHAPVATQDSHAPVTTQDGYAPVTTQDSHAPVTTQDGYAPVTTQDSHAPVLTQDSCAPVATQASEVQVVIQNSHAPVVTQDTSAPVVTQDGHAPVVTQDISAPVATQDISAPVVTQDGHASVVTQDISAPVVTQDTSAQVAIQDGHAPVVTRDGHAPVVTWDGHAPVVTRDGQTPVSIQDSHAPVATQDSDTSKPTHTFHSATQDITACMDSHHLNVYLAESMVKELKSQQKLVEACRAEANYIETCTATMMAVSGSLHGDDTGMVSSTKDDRMGIRPAIHVDSTTDSPGVGMGIGHDKLFTSGDTELPLISSAVCEQQEEQRMNEVMDSDVSSVGTLSTEIYLAKSLVEEVRAQQKLAEACKAETRYVEVCTMSLVSSREEPTSSGDQPSMLSTVTENDGMQTSDMEMAVGMGTGLGIETEVDLGTSEHVQNEFEVEQRLVLLQEDETQLSTQRRGQEVMTVPAPLLTAKLTAEMLDASTNTEPPQMCSQSTNTMTPEVCSQGVNTDPPPIMKETGCNTAMNCFDVLQRAKEMEELQFLKVEHRIAVTEMNEAKSQKMVAEQLTKIVQSDLAELRQQNLTETTRRLQLENELSDAKVELSQTAAQLKEKEERVQELEDSLTGTSLLVRKLEEQNAVSLMNRGGIDYMLQAKLADGRAQEAEQKLEVVQSELLQSQAEVRRLLERVSEASRDRSEMVSSRVHTQLMQIADERAQAAERKALELEKELHDLRGRISIYEGAAGGAGGAGMPTSFGLSTGLTGSSGLTGLTSYSGLSTLGSSYSTSGLGSTYSPFSYTNPASKPLTFAEQYNLHGGMGSLSSSTSTVPLSSSSSPFLPTTTSSALGGTSFNKTTSSLLSTSSGGGGGGGHGIASGHGEEEVSGEGMSGLLKPSQIFKKYGSSVSHDQPDGGDTSTSYITPSLRKDQGEIDLPSLEATPSKPRPLPTVSFKNGDDMEPGNLDGCGHSNDSDSSDWSSSSDSEVDGGAGEGGGMAVGGAMKPSHHTNLIAEWEWRTMSDGPDTSSAHTSSSPLNKHRAPPPVAPKPHGLSKVMKTGSLERTVQFESSTSFETPTHAAAIQGLRKPRGPRGRSLPSRFRWQQHLVT